MISLPAGLRPWHLLVGAVTMFSGIGLDAQLSRTAEQQLESVLTDRLLAEAPLLVALHDGGSKIPEGQRWLLIAEDGTVVAGSDLTGVASSPGMNGHADVVQARMSGRAISRIEALVEAPGDGRPVLRRLLQVTAQVPAGRVIRLSAPLPESGGDPWAVSHPATLTLGGAWLLWMMALISLGRREERRISTVIGSVQALAMGVPEHRIDLPGDDGYARIAKELTILAEHERQTRDRLAGQSRMLELTLDGLAEGVACIDRLDRVLYANPAYRQFAAGGIDSIGILGEPFYRHLANEALGSTLTALREGRNPGRIPVFEHRRRIFEVVVADGGQGLAVLVLHDRTEVRRLEVARRDFLSAVSHELKTPLTAIVGFTDTLLDGAIDEPSVARGFVEGIGRHADRLANLVRDVLTLSRLEQGSWEQRPESVDFRKLALVVLEDHGPAAQAKPVTFTLDCPDSVPGICDPELFRQLAGNLVSNAIRYNRPGGEVRLVIGMADGQVRMRVSDTGIGIPLEHRDRIFERFYRVDGHRSRQTGGTGLGLAIVRHLVEALRGTIDFNSGEGGTTFTVMLPLGDMALATPGVKTPC